MGIPLEEKVVEILTKTNYLIRSDSNELIVNPQKKLIIESFESKSLIWFKQNVKNIVNVQLVGFYKIIIQGPWLTVQNDTGKPFSEMLTENGLKDILKYSKILAPVNNILQKAKQYLGFPPGNKTNLFDMAKNLGFEIHTWVFFQ
jgi:glycerophosphoryl diester phosphodiesterase